MSAGIDLTSSLIDLADCLLGVSRIRTHPCLDGTRRIGHTAMQTTRLIDRAALPAAAVEQPPGKERQPYPLAQALAMNAAVTAGWAITS